MMSPRPVVVERGWPRAVSLKAIARLDTEAGWCTSANGARPVLHALRTDQCSSICIYDAPDAEALRRVSDTLGVVPTPRIWAATEHHDTDTGRPALSLLDGEFSIGLVERHFDQPTSFEVAQAVEAAAGGCLTTNRVRFLRSYLSVDELRMLCLYAAPDLEAIRTANVMIGLPMSGVLHVLVRTPD